MEIALVGMPNCGKSTLFNALTGKHARTGNRAGVTVSLTKAKLRGARHIMLTDLPGIYAPVAGSEDEALTHRTLQADPPDLLLFVADGTQLSRALELLTALRAGHRTVLAVNMCDELEKAGVVLDTRKLSNALDIPVFAVSARNGQGVPELAQYLKEIAESVPDIRQIPTPTPNPARQSTFPASTAKTAAETGQSAKYPPKRAAFSRFFRKGSKTSEKERGSGNAAQNPPIRDAFCGRTHTGCAGCIFGHTQSERPDHAVPYRNTPPGNANRATGLRGKRQAESNPATGQGKTSGAPIPQNAVPGSPLSPRHTAYQKQITPTAHSARTENSKPAATPPRGMKPAAHTKIPPYWMRFAQKRHTPDAVSSSAPAGQNTNSGACAKQNAVSGTCARQSAVSDAHTGAYTGHSADWEDLAEGKTVPSACVGQSAGTHNRAGKKGVSDDRAGQNATVGAHGGVPLSALPPPPPRGRLQNAADRLLTPWTGFPCLLLFLAAALFFSFGAPGAFLAGKFSALLALPPSRLVSLFAGRLPPFLSAFLQEGVLAGTLAVLDFAPRLFLLFLFLTVLEDSGYLARAGALAAPVLRFFGLSGDAAVPLLLGVGCSVPAVLSTRHIRDGATRRLSLLLLPFIPCSARLPVIAVLSALFFASPFAARVIPVLGGVLLFLLFAFALSRKSRPAPFAGELPRYRVPSAQNVLRVAARRTGHFLGKAGVVIPLAAAVLWLLSHITPHGAPTGVTDLSLLAVLSGKLAPLFAPLGFGNWQAVAALISGIAAKETVLSALAVFAGGDLGALAGMFSPRGALAFLCFFATYTPCVATLGAIRREGGWFALLKCLFFSFAGAYALAFLVYRL